MTMMLLEWVCTAAFLILVVLALRAALGRRISAGLRYALWAVVLLRLLVPVQLFTSPIAGTWVVTEKRMEHSVTKAPFAPAGLGDAPSLGGQHVPALEAGQGDEPGFPNLPSLPDAPEPPEAPVPPAAPDLTRLSLWLGWTWLAGAGVAALVLLLSNLRFYGRLRRVRTRLEGADCPLAVYAVPGLPSPCLFGLLRPVVYVTPETAADSAMLRHVLAHEYTHFRHGDHIWSLLRCAALAVHWWNPLVWLAAGLSRRDAELACDEGAIKRLGDGERAAYGGTLLSLVTAKPGPEDLFRCATTMAGDKKSLKERITRIAQTPKRWLWAAVAVVLVTALACLCAFGQGSPVEPDSMDGLTPTYTMNGDRNVLIEGLDGAHVEWSREWSRGTNGGVLYLAGDLGRLCPRLAGESTEGGADWEDAEKNVLYVSLNVNDDRLRDGTVNGFNIDFTVDLSKDAVTWSRFTAELEGRTIELTGQEMLDMAHILAKLLTEAEAYYDSHAGTPAQWTDVPELLAKFPANAADVPEDVVHFAGQVVQERYTTYLDYLRENPVSDEPIQFDGWQVDALNGPWRGTVRDMDLEVWSINYLFHTTTPKEAENLIVGGNYLTEDGWLCPTYPNCTYVIFQVNGAGELNFLTAEMINDCSPGGASDVFFETVAAALGAKGLADFHSGPDLSGVPEDVVQAAKGRVQAAYDNWRGDTSLKGTPQFDDWRIYDLTGPWEEATETARFEVWRLGYEIHTTTPDRVKVMDGMSLHPDGWFRPAKPDSLYLLFNVKDGGRTYLTDISSTDCGPGDPEFHDLLERLGGRLAVPENLPETDLNRNGVPETPRLALIEGGTGQRLELWEEGKLIFSEEGYFSHVGYNALFLYREHGRRQYLLRYHPYMGQGTASYTFELFTLSPTGEEVTAREGYVEFDINFQSPAHGRFTPKGIAEFMGDVNGMLADSVQLLNTDVDLLDTFRKEGRLYDSLGWLDGWEPVFARDESRSLEDNLRAFQAAMEEQRENERADWGLTLTVSGVTPTGLTLTFTQSGGQPTGELEYGSRYWLERKDGEGWTRRSDILEPSVNLAWTDEAYMIPMNDQTSWEVDWSWLYGRLSPGRYRIGKEVTDFRKTGDYDTQNYYAEFEVK